MATLSPVVQEYVDAYAKTQTLLLNTVEAWAEQTYSGLQTVLAATDNPTKVPTKVDAVETVDAIFAQLTKGIELQQSFFRGLAEVSTPLVNRAVTDTQTAVETFTAQATEAAKTATAAATKPAARTRKS